MTLGQGQELGRVILTASFARMAVLTWWCPCDRVLGCHQEEFWFHSVLTAAVGYALIEGML